MPFVARLVVSKLLSFSQHDSCVGAELWTNVAGDEIQDTPNFGGGLPTPYLLGMAKIKEKVKILLDIDQVVNPQEVLGLEDVAA